MSPESSSSATRFETGSSELTKAPEENMSVMMITALPNKMAGRGHLAWPALGARNAPTRAMARHDYPISLGSRAFLWLHRRVPGRMILAKATQARTLGDADLPISTVVNKPKRP